MLRSKLIIEPVYEQKYMLVQSNSAKEYIDKFKLENYDSDSEVLFATTSRHYIIENGLKKSCIFILLNTENKYKKISFGTIAHECLHAMHFCFDHRGIELDLKNPEYQTYYLGWLVNQVVDFMGYETKIK